ncbi:proline-rich receptor-like protein kinase PERK2 [Iris pallida]|uniref:Proline-rich receptor-like protein kinase PERK2 n=1 Tax=Iris pallida TaxID=29817 RepID=A0AAX6ESH7_IRIPA|nr:proline-rich receptor-like protein kinase PERK2 [Iris pallida]KAJ6807147.1 proline-rich receptor-like protein kinase PERK2 [Iris pallida]
MMYKKMVLVVSFISCKSLIKF